LFPLGWRDSEMRDKLSILNEATVIPLLWDFFQSTIA
jgi:hypothetical protein